MPKTILLCELREIDAIRPRAPCDLRQPEVYRGTFASYSSMNRCIIFIAAALLAAQSSDGARSLSARRVRGSGNAQSENKYDRSVTTFSDQGRLLQVEYATVAAEERGRGLTVCVELNGVVIMAFPSSSLDFNNDAQRDQRGDNRHNPSINSKIHRLSPTHLLLTSGLAGDSSMLASSFRRVVSSHTHVTFDEVILARDLASELGSVMHSMTLIPGSRVLAVIGLLIGLDDVEDEISGDIEAVMRMYRVLPGQSHVERCNVCCTGGGADAIGSAARKDATQILLDKLGTPDSSDKVSIQQIAEEVGSLALKYHPNLRDTSSNEEDVDNEIAAVDIWLAKALSTDEKKASPHRMLGKALMDVRLARRVTLDQISKAVDCLLRPS